MVVRRAGGALLHSSDCWGVHHLVSHLLPFRQATANAFGISAISMTHHWGVVGYSDLIRFFAPR